MNKTVYVVSEHTDKLKMLGRTRFTPKGLELSWSGSGCAISPCARRIVLTFADAGASASPVMVGVYVNGKKETHALQGERALVVVEAEEGITALSVLRLSAGDQALYLESIELWGEDELALLPPPEKKKNKILFIGDSITCGYGTDSSSSHNIYHTWEEDVTHAYAYLTAEHFDADYQIIAISGQGIVLNCRGEHGRLFCEFFGQANRTPTPVPDESGFSPRLVVVNGGTNDNGKPVPQEDFKEGVDHLLTLLRANYPDAYILWIYGAMNAPYHQVLVQVFDERQKTDENMSYVNARPIYDNPAFVGANGHPTHLGQIDLAEQLTKHIHALGLFEE